MGFDDASIKYRLATAQIIPRSGCREKQNIYSTSQGLLHPERPLDHHLLSHRRPMMQVTLEYDNLCLLWRCTWGGDICRHSNSTNAFHNMDTIGNLDVQI